MKHYKIRKGSIANYAIRTAKPLGCLAVAALILAAYSLACADDYEMHKRMEASYEQVSQVENSSPNAENDILNAEIEEEAADADTKWTSLGTFKVTAYCPCEICCGIYSDGITANGLTAREGITVAADTSVLPFGTVIRIDGHEYEVQDRGGAVKGNRIDIFMNSHEACLEFGRQTKEVEVKR